LAIFLVIYGFDCGQGFIADDFAWIVHGRLDGFQSLRRLFGTSQGFYRPLVSVSFGINHAFFALNAFGYGLTNLALAVACGVLVAALAKALKLPAVLATLAAALWLFNFHGISMAILWLSGRTSLLLTMFSLLAILAFLRGRPLAASAAAAAALFSKEEATLLPLMLSLVSLGLRRMAARAPHLTLPQPTVASTMPLWGLLLVYLGMRVPADAIWPTNAPDYYRVALSGNLLLENVTEYADRALTFSAAAALVTSICVRRLPAMSDRTKAVAAIGTIWLIGGFALTLFLPVRSSLYAVFPSVGAALIGAAVIGDLITDTPSARQRRLGWAAVCILALLIPIYWSRNVRWTQLARLSTSVISQLRTLEAQFPTGTSVVIVDDPSTRTNLTNAWGGLVPEMAQLNFHGRLNVAVIGTDADRRSPSGTSARFQMERGRLVPLTAK
jgi:hypothetical protein